MVEFKFIPYLTEKRGSSKNGYEYILLKEDTPKELVEEYMEMVEEQDRRIKNNEPIVKY